MLATAAAAAVVDADDVAVDVVAVAECLEREIVRETERG